MMIVLNGGPFKKWDYIVASYRNQTGIVLDFYKTDHYWHYKVYPFKYGRWKVINLIKLQWLKLMVFLTIIK